MIFNGSPKAGGNTDFLIDRFMTFLGEKDVVKFVLREMNISPCRGCEKCSMSGRCVIKDDMHDIYEKIEKYRFFLFFSPVFFGGVPSILKSAIDRCQPFWARKNILGKKFKVNKRKGLVVLIGGTSFVKGYECAALSVKWLFNVIDVAENKTFYYMNIERHSDFLNYNIDNDIYKTMEFFGESER
ncbi:NADPH-dependent FMN reductase [Thermodesulfobium narugense DSM 14796]|uniref:NADPH-dependent FMN reductase n=1 Tax=Thermodesulfobium narugense DSM 14796 TaxID=747365 RepID=M1E4B4_9BACT|nr:NADPH-dependent FMN reductase [Thermodesulfobium narugense DSM 14796]